MHNFLHTPPSKLVLASGSHYRRALLRRLQLPFDVINVNIDESAGTDESPASLAQRLSQQKAQAAPYDGSLDTLFIGSDQVASCEGEKLGKPMSVEGAVRQLAFCAGHLVTFYTGLALWRPAHSLLSCDTITTQVRLRPLDQEAIERYVEQDQPLDCAGSFKWESLGISLFEKLIGDDPTALEGLPLITLCRRLREHGYQIP